MSDFSSTHSLIHPLLSFSTCVFQAQEDMSSRVTHCGDLVTSFSESILSFFQSFSTY